jgi:hypothetical protein
LIQGSTFCHGKEALMAKIIPQASEAELRSWRARSEAEVYRAMLSLPDEITVLHGLSTLELGPNGVPRDGEADFVVLDPNRGLLVVEAKGGDVSWDGHAGKWSRGIRDPFEQGMDRKYDLKRYLIGAAQKEGLKLGSMRLCHAVLFTDVDDVAAVRRPNAPPAIVGARPDLSRIGEWIASVYGYWAGLEPMPNPLGEPGVVVKLLCASFSVQPHIGLKTQRDAEIQAYWTDMQWQALRGFRQSRKVAVAGPAGTGKTLLAVRRAQELAADGKKTLLLCYNSPLGASLKRENLAFIESGAASPESLHTYTFPQFCKWWIAEASARAKRDFLAEIAVEFPGASTYDVHLPLALADALGSADPGFDAIIIDEGQDLCAEYWRSIDVMSRKATLVVFYDPNQDLRRKTSIVPNLPEPYCLQRNCRNTDLIHDLAYRHYRGPEVDPLGVPGSPLMKWTESSLERQAHRIAAEIRKLIVGKVPAGEIAVLVLDSTQKLAAYEALKREAQRANIPLAKETHGQTRWVILDTVARFKGLEAGTVVLWLNGPVDAEEHREFLYVGLSRARFILALAGDARDCDILCGG